MCNGYSNWETWTVMLDFFNDMHEDELKWLFKDSNATEASKTYVTNWVAEAAYHNSHSPLVKRYDCEFFNNVNWREIGQMMKEVCSEIRGE